MKFKNKITLSICSKCILFFLALAMSLTALKMQKKPKSNYNIYDFKTQRESQYCTVSGTKNYNLATLKTTNASKNISYSGNKPDGNYTHFSKSILQVNQNSKFNLEITQSNSWSRTIVWIDWNGNNNFTDSGERTLVFGKQNQKNNGPFNQVISIPKEAVKGKIRMRIVTGDAWSYNDEKIPNNPCGILYNSSTKDFDIEIRK